MLKKQHRLNSKDVRYMLHRRNVFWTKCFFFNSIPQYSNKKYNQISIYVALKLIKSAVDRHYVKRRLLEVVEIKKAENAKDAEKAEDGCIVLPFVKLQILKKFKNNKNMKIFI